MPRVPTYDSPTVAPQSLPGARVQSIASPDLLDAGGAATEAGRAAQSLGHDLTRIQTDIQERANADQVFRAESRLKADALQFDNDQRQRKGVQAWDATKDASKWWDDASPRYAEGLTNDAQRAAFSRTFAALRDQSIARTSVHEANERRSSLEESARASIAGSINSAAANWSMPGAVSSAIDDITRRGQAVAQLNGWTPERRTLEDASNLTQLHKQVLQNMVEEDPDQAARYFETYREQILGAQRDGIERAIRGAKFTKTAQAFGDRAVTLGMTEGDAIAAARAQFSGEEEKQVVLEVKTRFHEQSSARESMQRDAADTAWGVFARTGRISAIPQVVRDKLDGRVLIALQHEAEAKANKSAIKTDPDTHYTLRQMAVKEPERFAALDLRGYFNRLDKGDREQLIDLQGKVQKPATLKDARTFEQQLTDAHHLFGWKKGDEKKMGAFNKSVADAVDVEEKRVGKTLDYGSRQVVIDRMALKEDGPWYRSNRMAYEVAGTPDAAAFRPAVPEADRKAILERLKARGVASPTDDQVQQVFRRMKGL